MMREAVAGLPGQPRIRRCVDWHLSGDPSATPAQPLEP
jgi:hypothetical protein